MLSRVFLSCAMLEAALAYAPFAEMFGFFKRPPHVKTASEIFFETYRGPPQPPENLGNGGKKARVFFSRDIIIARAWPWEGGQLYREVDGLDLLQLNVSRTESLPRSDPFNQTAEDEWADTLRRIAPMWISKDDSPWRWEVGAKHKQGIEAIPVYVAWPTDGKGVWILRCEGRWGEEWGFAAYRACLTIDERIEMLKKFGGQFYEDPKDVYELGKGYTEEIMELHKDDVYQSDGGICHLRQMGDFPVDFPEFSEKE